jgi:predicted MFS family arabinose efflux permease
LSTENNNPLNPYARYFGKSVQMLAIIAGSVFGGYKTDQWLGFSFPIFTLLFSLGGVSLAIWLFIKEFNSNN